MAGATLMAARSSSSLAMFRSWLTVAYEGVRSTASSPRTAMTDGPSSAGTHARPISKAGITNLVAATPTEGFNLVLKLALMDSIFVASPFVLGQVWLFIAPGLYKHERRYALPFIFFSSLLFVLGGLFGYFVAFPFALQFLLQWEKDMGLQTLINASEYFDLFIMVELGLAVIAPRRWARLSMWPRETAW